ncbi:unnamed protein product, partial [Schistocephalus solidus]|uniref:Reverse transcriptase domain-containing protein n=1 Tax=Schistocephalus solidus TaxID=70667 RepID=A0A183T637_SCHSO
METFQFTKEIIQEELLHLKEAHSPGPDAISAKLLKELASEMAKPLALLFQASFATGCLPSEWKTATITLLFKNGYRASANNYRPVSLTSVGCKIMVKIIKKALVQFPEQNHLLSDAQHCFCSGGSCLTNLLFSLERWTKARNEGRMVHAIYIDFNKALTITTTTTTATATKTTTTTTTTTTSIKTNTTTTTASTTTTTLNTTVTTTTTTATTLPTTTATNTTTATAT